MSSIGTSSTPAGIRERTPATPPTPASAAVTGQASGSPNVSLIGTAPVACSPPKNSAITTGVTSTTTSTRRYCMNATSRSSAPSSPDMPTMPDAPPAIIPSAAVGRSSTVVRASIHPAARLSAMVASETSVIASHESPSARRMSASR